MLRRALGPLLLVLSLSTQVAHATPVNLWAHRYTGIDDKGFNEITVDPFGNIAGIGYFYNTITINTLFTSPPGFRDIFVAKFDPDGNPMWSKHLGGAHGGDAMDVATDPVGNVIAVGGISNSIGDEDAMVVKYAPDGTQRFLKQFGASEDSTQVVEYVTTDRSKNIIIAGEFLGSFSLGGATLHDQGGPTIFMAKLDQLGNQIWSKRFVGALQYIYELGGMETGSDGQTTLFGVLDSTINFGNGPLVPAGGSDIFLAKFDSNGNVVWAHKYGDAGDQFPGNIAINEADQIAMTGFASSPIDLGGGALTPTGGFDPYVGVFSPAGAHIWSKIFTGAGIQYGSDITWCSNQDVLLAVRGNGTLDFGGGPLTIPGTYYDSFLVRFFGATGNHRWSAAITSTGGLFSLVEEDHGKVILGGGVAGDVNFGSGVLTGTADDDAFIAKFSDVLSGVSSPVVKATLEQNVPNPFNPATTIAYTLSAPGHTVVDIYDAAGAVVTRLDQGIEPAGAHAVTWNGRDRGGRAVASGVYFYRLEGMPEAASRKMVLLK